MLNVRIKAFWYTKINIDFLRKRGTKVHIKRHSKVKLTLNDLVCHDVKLIHNENKIFLLEILDLSSTLSFISCRFSYKINTPP